MTPERPDLSPQSTPPVTIYDIAEVAGVSPSTVSRAFSRPDRVSFTTAEKIRTIAAELGYRSTLETRNTVSQNKDVIGFIAADLRNQFFVEILRGASHAGWVEDVWVHASDVQESGIKARTAIEKVLPHVDGLILASSRLTNADIQKIARTTPTVAVNRPVPGVPSVLVDNYDGAIRLANHLADQGARSVTYLSWPSDSWADSMRWRALRDTFDGNGNDDTPLITRYKPGQSGQSGATERKASVKLNKIQLSTPDIRGGQEAFQQWKKHPTDAVVCFNDLSAAGFHYQATMENIAIPEDVLIAGFDNIEVASLASPRITTVAGPLRAVGRVSAANLIALIRGVKKPLTKPRVLPTRLIVRGSTLRAETARAETR
ncbi:LacI family DNA-binding transcriptional regulator [Corynebacterium lubricantis]|uniref:LacI family DNA-binding transcriptional regulator n=1 Tax=Corynebacterium lubricantis TaxID=541095 RepID=UPI00038181C9|nr:LacI family DNA-binding transcriptional regulator [Corynebacterium lubricantis]